MAEIVTSSAMAKLERLLVKDAAPLPPGANEQVRYLMEYLNKTLTFLKNSGLSGKKLEEGSIHHHWMSEVMEMAHDADVAIDIFIFNLQKSKGVKSESMRMFASSREKVDRHLKNIRLEIDAIWEKIQQIQKHGRLESPPTRSTRVQPHEWVQESDVVGLKEDVDLLLQKVIFNDAEEEEGVSTLCIAGMGGVGKTTLAQKLYDDERVVYEFPCLAWVYVSSEFSAKEVLKDLILQLGVECKEEMMEFSDESLREMVSESLRGRRYFIVLDDVWRGANLEVVLRVFHHQDKASRLLLPSRTRNIIRRDAYTHEMKILAPKESWQLFLKTVFVENTKCPNELEKIGKKILTKCNGLPLAIVVVGNQLSNKKHLEKEWERFLESMDLSIVSSVLELSYHKLPPKLKSCFLSFGFFKEGTTIRVEKLVHFWTTGGILSQGEEKDEIDENIARKYLDELINQYMVEVKDLSSRDSRVKNCCINDNLHRLAVAKAEEEIRFEVIRNDGKSLAPYKPRHGAIHCSRDKFNYSTNQVKHLVSLFIRGGVNFEVSLSYWKSFELLERLDFEGFGLKNLPEMVGELVCLKYLGLRNNFLQELPRSLRSLKRLEVLDIAQNFIVRVPDIIRKMDSLRHLYISDLICCWKPLKIDSLKNLQTLTYISFDCWTYELSGLEMMNSLRKLGIEELDGAFDISKMLASLAKLKNLDFLILRGSNLRSMPSLDELGILNCLTQLKLDGLIAVLPSADNFPPNIRYLTIANTSLVEDPMTVLEKLSKLIFLKLRNAFTGEQMVVSEFGFAELRVVCIGELWDLRNLQVGEGAMRKLERVEINNCPYLKTLPEVIELMANTKKSKIVTTKGIARKISAHS